MVMHALRSGSKQAELDHEPAADGESASRLDVFPSEIESPKLPVPTRRPAEALLSQDAAGKPDSATTQPRGRVAYFSIFVLMVAMAMAGVVWLGMPSLGPEQGSLRVETEAAGADVILDGTYRGKTPLLLSLAAGDHSLVVQQGTASRTLPVSIVARETVVHHISMPAAQPGTQATGGVEITSEPVGQSVIVDGQPSGVTPLTITGLSPGAHEIMLRRDGRFIRRTVQIDAGVTASLMVTTGLQGPSSGWLTVSVPIPLQVYEGSELIGTSASERILVPSGTHTYDLVNTALGFRVTETVQISAGQTASLTVSLPRGTINVNAVPWAQVWLDGQPLGETPIGNVTWTIGEHELILRHPDLGERRVTATITTGEPTRVAVDMRMPQ